MLMSINAPWMIPLQVCISFLHVEKRDRRHSDIHRKWRRNKRGEGSSPPRHFNYTTHPTKNSHMELSNKPIWQTYKILYDLIWFLIRSCMILYDFLYVIWELIYLLIWPYWNVWWFLYDIVPSHMILYELIQLLIWSYMSYVFIGHNSYKNFW